MAIVGATFSPITFYLYVYFGYEDTGMFGASLRREWYYPNARATSPHRAVREICAEMLPIF